MFTFESGKPWVASSWTIEMHCSSFNSRKTYLVELLHQKFLSQPITLSTWTTFSLLPADNFFEILIKFHCFFSSSTKLRKNCFHKCFRYQKSFSFSFFATEIEISNENYQTKFLFRHFKSATEKFIFAFFEGIFIKTFLRELRIVWLVPMDECTRGDSLANHLIEFNSFVASRDSNLTAQSLWNFDKLLRCGEKFSSRAYSKSNWWKKYFRK